MWLPLLRSYIFFQVNQWSEQVPIQLVNRHGHCTLKFTEHKATVHLVMPEHVGSKPQLQYWTIIVQSQYQVSKMWSVVHIVCQLKEVRNITAGKLRMETISKKKSTL